ncbi:MAG: lysylphosphatidylglycerol synthase domain-containing protein, partial [Spirochaetota bacterium]
KDNKKSLIQALGLAFLLQFNVILYFFVISRALEIDSYFYYFMIIVPLVHVILMFPVSINGIGVRENAFIFFLSKIGVHPAGSLALSLLSFGMVLVYAFIGGIVYAFRR